MGWIDAGSIICICISFSADFNPSSLILFGNRLLNSYYVKPSESNLVTSVHAFRYVELSFVHSPICVPV